MNYSVFNQVYNINQQLPHIERQIPQKKYKNNKKQHQTKNIVKNEKAIMLTKGIIAEDELDPVTILFFSDENIHRIQSTIKKEVEKRTNGKYKLEDDQDESDLLVIMRNILFDVEQGSKFLPTKIKRQVKQLNRNTVNYVVPDMIESIKQHYKYLEEINTPLQPMLRPTCMNSAGRKTLPSITTIWNS